MLCCNITAQIPIAPVHALFDKMPENTVKHHVQISPVHKNPILPVQAPKLLRVKIYHCSIRSKGTEEFNQLEGYNLQTGFTSMDGEMVFYVPRFSMAQRWAEKRGNYDDLLCRTVAFYLVEDFLSLTDSQSSTMMVCDKELMRGDREVIERNPAIMWTEDTKNKYYSVFQPVKTRTDCRNAEQRAAAVNSYWKTLELSFENNRPSLITVWGNVQGKDSSYIFSVHAGVLVEDGEDILFLEKISPLYPYQATIFKDRGQLVTYLVAKQQSFGADFGKIFVMENNILLH